MRELTLTELSQVSGGGFDTDPSNPRERGPDDSGNRYYDSWLGSGTTTQDGKFWTDTSGGMHMTGWYEERVADINTDWVGVSKDLVGIGIAGASGAGESVRAVVTSLMGYVAAYVYADHSEPER